jgi:hypothetical protein
MTTTTNTTTCPTCQARDGHPALHGLCDFCHEMDKLGVVFADSPIGATVPAFGAVTVAAKLTSLAAEHADASYRRSARHGLMDPSAMFEAGMSQAYLHAAACLRSMIDAV